EQVTGLEEETQLLLPELHVERHALFPLPSLVSQYVTPTERTIGCGALPWAANCHPSRLGPSSTTPSAALSSPRDRPRPPRPGPPPGPPPTPPAPPPPPPPGIALRKAPTAAPAAGPPNAPAAIEPAVTAKFATPVATPFAVLPAETPMCPPTPSIPIPSTPF